MNTDAPKPPPSLHVRVIVEAGSAAEAEEEMRAAASRLQALAPVERHRIEKYWKFPDNWDVTLYLSSGASTLATFAAVLGLAGAGWHVGEADALDRFRWAVWNPVPGVVFLTPRVRWAEVQLWDIEPVGEQEEG